jgi:hypothetical protein
VLISGSIITGIVIVFYILGSIVLSLTGFNSTTSQRWQQALINVLSKILVGALAAFWYALSK